MKEANKNWSEKEEATLRKETDEGWSAKRISESLPGRTREAVIGKWHRSEWYTPTKVLTKRPPRPRPKKEKPKPKPKVEKKRKWTGKKTVEEVAVEVELNIAKIDETPRAEDIERSKTLVDLDLDKECRWVIMSAIDAVPALYCARPRAADHHCYCRAHVRVGYNMTDSRRR